MSKKHNVNCTVVQKMFCSVLLLLCSIFVINCNSENDKENTDNNPYEFHIGGVLSGSESENYFKQTIEVTYTFFKKYFR